MTKSKKPLESKKFIFGLLTLLSLIGAIVAALITQTIGWPLAIFMCVLAVGIVTLGMGYVLGVASLDKWENIIVPFTRIGGDNESDPDEPLE